jgi:DNA-binding response OmpR family regulator
MNRAFVFIVEDDPKIKRLVCQTLEKEGFQVKSAGSLFRARNEICRNLPDLIILDRGLPDGDGADFCQELRTSERTKHIAVLFLTVKRGLTDRITGLKIGGDDYLSKPFRLEELVARVEAILRRVKRDIKYVPKVFKTKGIMLDIDKHECRVGEKAVKLWPKEFELLQTFLERQGRVLSREFLSERVWDWGYLESSHTIDTTVQRLRKKLGKRADLIETVKGYGFRIKDENE